MMGKKPATLARVAEFSEKVKAVVRGETIEYEEISESVQFSWAEVYELPVWIAAYGPKALRTAGEYGDGLILQIAEPAICQWLADQAIAAGKAAGRDMSRFRVMAAAPAFTGPMAECIERTRWFPAMVGNHVADIVEKYGQNTDEVPHSLTEYIEKRRGYDYRKHGQSDNPYLDFITPDIVKGFGVLGDIEQHIEKLNRLRAAGITQFNIYLDNGDEERLIADYAEKIIPKFA
jgi:probable F420-dependent oxidoreductase